MIKNLALFAGLSEAEVCAQWHADHADLNQDAWCNDMCAGKDDTATCVGGHCVCGPRPTAATRSCHANSMGPYNVSDAWCNDNCNHNPAFCPPDFCHCDDKGTFCYSLNDKIIPDSWCDLNVHWNQPSTANVADLNQVFPGQCKCASVRKTQGPCTPKPEYAGPNSTITDSWCNRMQVHNPFDLRACNCDLFRVDDGNCQYVHFGVFDDYAGPYVVGDADGCNVTALVAGTLQLIDGVAPTNAANGTRIAKDFVITGIDGTTKFGFLQGSTSQ